MEPTDGLNTKLYRRKLIKSIGGLAAIGSIGQLLGCGAEGSGDSAGSSSGSSSSSSSSSSSTGSSSSSGAAPADGWATGGTAALQTDFPPANPFANGSSNVCSLTGDLTLGPCYFDPEDYREDISDGEPGVPVIFAIQALDRQCQPMAGVTVDLWHTNCEGYYSGDNSSSSSTEPFMAAFCADNNSRALASRWHRGVQVTDADGVAYFKSCFPGWYAGRTTHIHLRFVNNNSVALDTQLCFSDALCDEIYRTHPDYTGIPKDVANMADSVYGATWSEYLMEVIKNDDRSMLAYKAVSLNV